MRARLLFICLASAASGGCASLATVQSAQALAPGQRRVVAGLEGMAGNAAFAEPAGEGAHWDNQRALVPFLGYRAGIHEGLEWGFRLNPVSTVGDLKLHFIDGTLVDVALDPTLQYAFTTIWAQLPLLVSVHLTDHIEIVASGRLSRQHVVRLGGDSQVQARDERSHGLDRAQFWWGAGLGLYLRLNDTWAIVPEAHFIEGFTDSSARLLTGSIGVAFWPK